MGQEWGTKGLRQLLWLGTESSRINHRIATWVIESVILSMQSPESLRVKDVEYWTHYWPKSGWTKQLRHIPMLFDDNKVYLVTKPCHELASVSDLISVESIGLADVGFRQPIVTEPPKEPQCYG